MRIFDIWGNCKELADLKNECFSLVLTDRWWVEGIVGLRVKVKLRNLAKYVDEGLIRGRFFVKDLSLNK